MDELNSTNTTTKANLELNQSSPQQTEGNQQPPLPKKISSENKLILSNVIIAVFILFLFTPFFSYSCPTFMGVCHYEVAPFAMGNELPGPMFFLMLFLAPPNAIFLVAKIMVLFYFAIKYFTETDIKRRRFIAIVGYFSTWFLAFAFLAGLTVLDKKRESADYVSSAPTVAPYTGSASSVSAPTVQITYTKSALVSVPTSTEPTVNIQIAGTSVFGDFTLIPKRTSFDARSGKGVVRFSTKSLNKYLFLDTAIITNSDEIRPIYSADSNVQYYFLNRVTPTTTKTIAIERLVEHKLELWRDDPMFLSTININDCTTTTTQVPSQQQIQVNFACGKWANPSSTFGMFFVKDEQTGEVTPLRLVFPNKSTSGGSPTPALAM